MRNRHPFRLRHEGLACARHAVHARDRARQPREHRAGRMLAPRRKAFLSTKFGLSLVDDDAVAVCVVDEPVGLDPEEDAEPAA
jgi:hypothetical protein